MTWAQAEYDRSQQSHAQRVDHQMSGLKISFQLVLGVVVAFALLLLWIASIGLKPLQPLTMLAREIANRGINKSDRLKIPEVSMESHDEISGLSREFYRMATALTEREDELESQKKRLEEQNVQLREVEERGRKILDGMDVAILVMDSSECIRTCNTKTLQLLEADYDQVVRTSVWQWQHLAQVLSHYGMSEGSIADPGEGFYQAATVGNRRYELACHRLAQNSSAAFQTLVVLSDLTHQLELEHRLQTQEKFAAIGQLSAQVAHEIRNPLHSIGLEAELVFDGASSLGNNSLRESAQSIMMGVERLEKITANYLKLSRMSSGKNSTFDLRAALESVLATYASDIQGSGLQVNWKFTGKAFTEFGSS